MRERKQLLLELIGNPRPDAVLLQELAACGMEAGQPLATVSRTDFITVLRQFEGGALTAQELKDWAVRLTARHDIAYEFGPEGALAEALFWLVYEEIGQWNESHLCEHIEAMLERRRRDRP